MKYRIRVSPQAQTDLDDVAGWYGNQQRGLEREFLAEARAALARAAANPFQFPQLHRQVRRILLKRFPYRRFFLIRADEIVVFRVLHTARHDRHWKVAIPKN